MRIFDMKENSIKWGLRNRKGGNCREKPNLLLYAKYVFYAEIRPDLALIHFLFFPVVSSLSIAKAPNVQQAFTLLRYEDRRYFHHN